MNADEDLTVADRTPDPFQLPQPGWRLIGFASIGLGSGLYNAELPFAILAVTLMPALIALLVIAAQATTGPSIAERTGRAGDVAHKR